MNEHKPSGNSWQWEAHVNRQKAAKIDALIADLAGTAAALESEIRHPETQAGISDATDMAYPMAAIAFRARLQNIQRTLRRLAAERQTAHVAFRPAAGSGQPASADGSTSPHPKSKRP